MFGPPPSLPSWLAPALPFRRRTFRGAYGPLHLVDHGEGPAVLLLHGNPTWCFLWRKVISRLGGHRVVAPDLLGLGLSHKPRRVGFHRLSRHVDAIVELVEALDVDRLVVVGQDWGGPVGAGVASALPEKVRGAVFANTAVLSPRRPPRVSAFHRFSHTPGLSDLAFRGLGFPLQVLDRAQGDRSSIGRFERRAYRWPLRHVLDRAAPLALARMVPDRIDHPTVPVLDRCDAWARGFTGPVELVWGTRDPILGRALGRMARAFRDPHVTETGAGHFLQEEVPWPLAEAIRRVVRRSA